MSLVETQVRLPLQKRSELAAIWIALISGTCKVKSWSHTENTWSLVVSRSRRPLSVAPGLRPRDVEILEHALLCGRRSLVAAETKLSLSSIHLILQSCLQFMGINCNPSRLPGLVVAAAHAHHQGRANRQFFPNKITVPRPDGALAAWLTPAELAVFKLLIEGRDYTAIARARHTSIRTVANQVTAGFRRLGVSGRAELLCLLAGFLAPSSARSRASTKWTGARP